MATEVGENDYKPVVYGAHRWHGVPGFGAAWEIELGHDLVITTGENDLDGFVLKAGSSILIPTDQYTTRVFVPMVATCYPADWDKEDSPVRAELELELERIKRPTDYNDVLDEVPF